MIQVIKIYQEHVQDFLEFIPIYNQSTLENLFEYKIISSVMGKNYYLTENTCKIGK